MRVCHGSMVARLLERGTTEAGGRRGESGPRRAWFQGLARQFLSSFCSFDFSQGCCSMELHYI